MPKLASWKVEPAYGRTDSPCVLQDFVPFGAAAQKGFLTMIYCEQEIEGDFYGQHLRRMICNPIFAALFALGAEIL